MGMAGDIWIDLARESFIIFESSDWFILTPITTTRATSGSLVSTPATGDVFNDILE